MVTYIPERICLDSFIKHAKLPVKGYVNKGLRNDCGLKNHQGYEDKIIALISKIIGVLFRGPGNKFM